MPSRRPGLPGQYRRSTLEFEGVRIDELSFNGVDGATGEYRNPPMSTAQLARFVRGERPERIGRGRGTVPGVDPRDLASSGWGVVFAHDADPAVQEALAELLSHRRSQASAREERFYQEYSGSEGLLPDESKRQFLARQGAGPGPVDPRQVPYYLLLVGGPGSVPFRFQQQLAMQYAVGRISFETPEEYARYARGVVEVETRAVRRPRRLALFGVRNADDRATELTSRHLVAPLAEYLAARQPSWEVVTRLAEEATKEELTRLLGGDSTPAVVVTASHGVGFSSGHARQRGGQGAILCQDWPGPQAWKKAVPEEHYFAAHDVAEEAELHGLVSFHVACYSAGMLRRNAFAHRGGAERREIAPCDFVARLPQRLLAHPLGGALAVVGHVDRAWGYSYLWPRAGRQIQTFSGTLERLLDGTPVGAAMGYFGERAAELGAELAEVFEQLRDGDEVDDDELVRLWTARNDARGWVLLGDPAVRPPVGDD